MWKTNSYEIMGRSHIKTETPCQDKTFTLNKNEVNVIALADGAGSASLSHFGAESATRSISHYLTEHFDSVIDNPDGLAVKQELLSILTENLKIQAGVHGCKLEDLASTLLVAALKNDNFLLIHLGDGVIAISKNQELKLASAPDNGEFTNSTYFVTSKNALQHLRLFKGSTKGLNGFVLMSDGTAESFYHRKTASLSAGVKKLMDWSLLLNQKKFDEFLDYNFKHVIGSNTMDDCSIAIIADGQKIGAIYENLALASKYDMFKIHPKNKAISAKRLAKFERVLASLSQEPQRLDALAKALHIKKKYLKRDLAVLTNLGIVTQLADSYQCHLVI